MKNVKRALLKRRGERTRKKSSAATSQDVITPTGSPIASTNRRVSDMPTSIARHVSPRKGSAPIPLVPTTTEAWGVNNVATTSSNATTPSNIPKVNVGFIDDSQFLLGREGVISITKDVQKFLATISELRQAMEELDAQTTIAPTIRLLSVTEDEDDEGEDMRDEGNGLMDDSFTEDEESSIMDEEDRIDDDNVNKKLKELVEIVHICLEANPGMQSTSLINASKDLLKTYKNCDHTNVKVCECRNCTRAIEGLVDIFTQCVSEYMIGDNTQITFEPFPTNHHNGNQVVTGGNGSGLGVGGGLGPNRSKSVGAVQKNSLGSSKSYDNLAMFSSNLDLSKLNDPVIDEIDQALVLVYDPIMVASNYIKLRQKYHRELVGYLNKRAQLEQNYYSQLVRLVKKSQNALTEMEQHEESLPLINVFSKSLEDDSRYAMNSNTTFNLQVTHKILEPLERQIQECEKSRKILVNNWMRESKKASESKSSMRAAKAKYELLGQDLVRLKNVLSNEPVGPKAEKRKKEITDLEIKWQESEAAYKEAVAHCNDCQYQVHEMAQKSILCAFRRIIIGFDTALKSGLESYFSLQHNFFQSLPDPLIKSIKETQEYEVGSQFLHFISLQRQAADDLEDYHFQEFDPESELWDVPLEGGSGTMSSTGGGGGTSINKLSSDLSRSTLVLSTTANADNKTGNEQRSISPSPFDLTGGLKSQHLHQRNETPSPKSDTHRRNRPKSMALLDTFTSVSSPNFFNDSPKNTLQRRNSDKGKDTTSTSSISPPSSLPGVDDIVYSKMAKTHSLKKLRTPARCRGCDTYVYFHGFDCEICGLACHRKCLATLAIRCGSKKLPRKMNVFGINFHDHLKATNRVIPIIVTKCINEVDIRGLDTQGLYRISSAKTKMEKLCQLFESGSERVDLSELPPHLISSCLKLYFRQLPEPLLTFGMYQEFLTFAREASSILPCNFDKCDKDRAEKAVELINRLKNLISRLSDNSQLTLARLMYHLSRVSSPDHVRVNCMPASNLGIVFGPNLLRQKEVVPSLALLANMSLQAKVVEIMVAHADQIFDISEQELIKLELDSSEEVEVSLNERSIDVEDTSAEVMKMKSTDINESRTPISTPPEKRKMKMEELSEVIEGFASGNLLSPVSHRSRVVIMTPPATASPLLQDSRQWQDPSELNTLPGSTELDNFAENIFNSIDRRLCTVRPHGTCIDKVLTPVIEMKDDSQQSEESSDGSMEKIRIQRLPDNSNIEKTIGRRRTQSLTKSCSTGFGEESDSIGESDVFHSRTASNASSIAAGEQGVFMGSHSEDNLLQHHDRKFNDVSSTTTNNNYTDQFGNDFMKYMSEERLSDSNDSLKYEPFDSPDVQALLKPSKPPPPLPHTYPRPNKPPHHHPTRQMSEGEIKHLNPVRFSVGSPPYDSPISFRSIDKSTSIASSQGSFSEGIVEDLSSPSDSQHSNKVIQLHNNKSETESEQASNNKLHEDSIENEKQMNNGSSSANNQPNDDDLPFPDNSPGIPNHKLLKNHHKHSLSRDSGLSDSPDPFSDLSPSPSHAINSHVLTDRLTQMSKSQLSPLVNRNQVSTRPDSLSENTKKFQELLETTTGPAKPRPTKLTKHVTRVMKITPTYTNENLLSPPVLDVGDTNSSPSLDDDMQRLRMASPDELLTPVDKSLGGFVMKRSLSHGATLRSSQQHDDEDIGEDMDEGEGRTIVGGLMITEVKPGAKGSRKISSHNELASKDSKVTRSLEDLIDNY